MSTQEDTELSQYVYGFVANLNLAPQQTTPRLIMGVDADLGYAKEGTMWNADDVGTSDPEPITDRAADTPNKFLAKTRRVGTFKPFHDAAWLDSIDKVRELEDPSSKTMQALMAGLARYRDAEIINSAFADVMTQTSPGVFATTTWASVQQQVAANSIAYAHNDEVVPGGGADYGLGIGKLLEAQIYLDASEIEGERYLAISAKQKANLLQATPATNQFYAEVKALVAGTINQFLGFNIVRTEKLLKTGNNRRCMAWVKPALAYNGRAIDNGSASIHIRTDKSRTPQAYYKTEHGAVRRYDTGIVEILCKE